MNFCKRIIDMNSMPKISIIIVVSVLISCKEWNKETKLDFSSAVGKYKSKYKQGDEFLELKNDSTYIYVLRIKTGEIYKFNGKWEGPSKDKFSNLHRLMITFYDWQGGIEPFNNSSIFKDENRIQHRSLVFTDDIIALKRVYVLRRSYDQQEEFDFIKIE